MCLATRIVPIHHQQRWPML